MSGEVVLFEAKDGQVRLDVRVERESVWLTLNQMAELFGRDKSVISRHLRNVFSSGELERAGAVAKNATTAADGKTYQVEYFNLDAILSVGYRVNSRRGTQFRIWATRTLREHLVRGYTLNERRLREKGLGEIEQAVGLLARTLTQHALVTDEGRAVLEVIQQYTRAWRLLLEYDEQRLPAAPVKPLAPYGDEKKWNALPKGTQNALWAQDDLLRSRGDLVAEVRAPVTVRFESGNAHITDGSFGQSPLPLAGFYVLEATDIDEAVELLSKTPCAHVGAYELRPLA